VTGVELFVYYRVRLDRLVRAHDAVRDLQTRLCLRHPALRARLLRRPEVEGGCETWMEIYTCDPDGLSESLCSEIEQQAGALAPLLEGARHVEAFVPNPPRQG
jgi:hypothetical protein